MKIAAKIWKLSFVMTFFTLSKVTYSQFVIQPEFYSQNAWYSNYSSTNPSSDAFLAQCTTNVKNSGARLIRIGGNDFNLLNTPSKAKIVQLIDQIRKGGM